MGIRMKERRSGSRSWRDGSLCQRPPASNCLAGSLQSEKPLTLILSPLRAGRGGAKTKVAANSLAEEYCRTRATPNPVQECTAVGSATDRAHGFHHRGADLAGAGVGRLDQIVGPGGGGARMRPGDVRRASRRAAPEA